MVAEVKKINISVLIAPLDWGLGHSTRCIPVITHLLHLGCKVLIASDGAQAALLRQEFPNVSILPLAGYKIEYTKQKRFFSPKIALQLPKIIKAINHENNWLKEIADAHKIDLIISDNRFGLYHAGIPSVFITHQLAIKSPVKWSEKIIQKLNYQYIEKFSECWVPDEAGETNLAGSLSHPKQLPGIPVKYIGGISRLSRSAGAAIKYKLLIVISGPEPQRTLLEHKLLQNLASYFEPVLLVRGLPGSGETLAGFNRVEIVNHLPAQEMQQAFLQSEMIISRSGYTTVMDLMKLQKKSIVIPTPGQTEQEYLARHLHLQRWCLHISQHEFTLSVALEKAEHFSYKIPGLQMDQYKKVIEDFIDGMK